MSNCQWIYDENYDVWETECGNLFCLNEGSPKDNYMLFCPYCGKNLEVNKDE